MISADFFSGWRIRTIAKGEPRYNPMSYHNGSIWLLIPIDVAHDNEMMSPAVTE
jgi:glycogen debranching enzyme